MRSHVKHTRLDFEPLIISCSIACDTPASPLVQVSNALLNEYEPDRSITPCVIRPFVIIKDKDGIFPEGNANAMLSPESMKWMLNGVDIKDIPEFAGKYTILTTDNELRGSLRLTRNIPVTEKYNITFEAKLEDWRRGKIETVQSNELSMYSSDLGEDLFRINVATPIVVYNPINDNLFLYDWMLANNLIEAGNRQAYNDSHSFERKVSLLINSGENTLGILPAGLSIELKEKGGSTVTPESNPEVVSVGYPEIEFDLRLIEKKEYEVVLLRGGKELSKSSFSIRRENYPIHECMPMFGSDISPHQEMYYNRAIVNLKDRSLTYPELYYRMQWFTEANIYDKTLSRWISAGEKKHNLGSRLEIALSETGVGVTKNNNYFSVGFDAEPFEAFAIATDSSGVAYTDSEGNKYII